MKTGILLPESTTHPLIPNDLIAGIKGALKIAGADTVSLSLGYIGFGTSSEQLKAETQKLIIENDVEIIVAFADHPVVEILFPLVQGLNKQLLIINNGAKYSAKPTKNVYYHTLNDAYNSYLTGGMAASSNEKAIVATSYYDGGYSVCHAIVTEYLNKGGEITYNFAGSFKIEEFNLVPAIAFIKENNVNTFLGILSGDLIPEFYKQLNAGLPDKALKIFASPVLLEETTTTYADVFPNNFTIEAFTSWHKDLENEENKIFQEEITNATGRKANAHSALGWDTGKILAALSKQKLTTGSFDLNSIESIQGAKGILHLDTITNHFISDAYLVKYSPEEGAIQAATITAMAGREKMREMLNQELEGPVSGWMNTYLCS